MKKKNATSVAGWFSEKKRTGVVGCLSGMKKKNATAIAGWLT